MRSLPIRLTCFIGYIGGTVLSRLLEHPKAYSFDITVLVRSTEKAHSLETFGVRAVVGTYEDSQLVEKLAEEARVVFTCVSPLIIIILYVHALLNNV